MWSEIIIYLKENKFELDDMSKRVHASSNTTSHERAILKVVSLRSNTVKYLILGHFLVVLEIVY